MRFNPSECEAKGLRGMKINRIKTEELGRIKAELEQKGQTDSLYYRHITEELARRQKV